MRMVDSTENVISLPTARVRRARSKSEVVYFVQAQPSGMIKIGIARDAMGRLGRMQTGSADKLVLLGVVRHDEPASLEMRLHSRFRQARSHGEWFHPVPELLDIIARHAVSYEHDRRAVLQAVVDRIAAQQEPLPPSKRPSARKALARYKAERGLT